MNQGNMDYYSNLANLGIASQNKEPESIVSELLSLASDTITSPIAAPTAVLADAGAALYNLIPAVTGLVDPVSTETVLKFVTDMTGYDNPMEYFNKHPDATQLAGLLVGGWKIGTMGGAAIANKLREGVFTVSTDAGKVSRLVAAQREVKHLAETVSVGSKLYKSANRKLGLIKGIDFAGEQAAQLAVMDIAMSQHAYMEDYDWKDYALGVGILGMAGFGIKTLPSLLKDTSGATDELVASNAKRIYPLLADVPADIKNTPLEAVHLQVRRNQIAKMLEEDSTITAPLAQDLNAIEAKFHARQIEIVDSIITEDLKVDTKVSSDLWPDNLKKLRAVLVNLVQTEATQGRLAGVKSVLKLNPKVIPDSALSRSVFTDMMKGLSPKQLANAKITNGDFLIQETRNAVLKGWTPEELGHRLGMRPKSKDITILGDMMKLHNQAVIDVTTGLIHDVDGVKHLLTSAEVEGLSYVKSLRHELATTQQVHKNLTVMAAEGQRLKNLAVDSVEGLGIEERTKIMEFITSGGKLAGRLHNKTFLDFHRAETINEVKTLLTKGKTTEEIAIRTNTDREVLDKYIAQDRLDEVELSDLIRAQGRDAWELEKQPKLFTLEGDIRKAKTAMDNMATLDREAVHANVKEIQMNAVRNSGSKLLNDLYDFQTSGLFKALETKMENYGLNPATFNATRTLSADMKLRNQSMVAEIIRAGDGIINLVRKHTTEKLKSIKPALQAIDSNSVERVMWNRTEAAIRSARPEAHEVVTVFEGKLGIGPRAGEMTAENFRPLLDAKGNELNNIPQSVIDFWIKYEAEISKELFQLQNFNKAMRGNEVLQTRGINLPPKNNINKFLAYIPKAGPEGRTLLLAANTEKGLEQLILSAKSKYPGYKVITRNSDAKEYNIIENHVELGTMTLAKFDKGKTSAFYDTVSVGSDQIREFQSDMASLYHRLGNSSMRAFNGDLVNFLRTMDDIGKTEGKTSVWKTAEKVVFGESELHLDNVWEQADNVYTNGLAKVLDVAHSVIGDNPSKTLLKAATFGKYGNEPNTLAAKAKQVLDDFEKAGIPPEDTPWKSLAQAVTESEALKLSPRKADEFQATLNFITASAALRFLEIAHPLVTMLSIPITTLPEITGAMKAAGQLNFSPMKLMMEGTHRAFSKAHESYFKRLDELGITNAQVSENTEKIRDMAVKGSLIQRADESKLFNYATMASDNAEHMARRVAASTASVIYERIAGAGAHRTAEGEAFVNLFVKRAMGNYTTSQRPIIFQGTLGAAIGLFQTYTWTMAQNVYRHLEAGNPGIVGRLVASQAATYGLASLPGFEAMNQWIGTHYGNPRNQDITTTIYDNLGEYSSPTITGDFDKFSLAETMLYGLPATLFDTALYTRGVLNPRSPVVVDTKLGGVGVNFAGASAIVAAFQTATEVSDRIRNGMGWGDSALAAIQLQQLSRPISRLADFAAGRSIEKTGAVVDPDVNLFALDLATFARLSGARPLKEQLLRDLGYHKSFYSKTNSHHRRETLKAIRGMIQNNQFYGAGRAKAYENYMLGGGSNNGWRSAINDAYLNLSVGKQIDLPPESAQESILMSLTGG